MNGTVHQIRKNAADYLRELHQNLEIARAYADIHSKCMQQCYVQRYNKRSRDKQFEVGDTVLILQPSSTTSRMFSAWKGPAEIIEKRSPYSYVVELDGARYRLHANQLRRFRVRVGEVQIDDYSFDYPVNILDNGTEESSSLCLHKDFGSSEVTEQHITAVVATCALIREEDTDFGEIQSYDPHGDEKLVGGIQLPSPRIDPASLSHLSDSERQQLLTVLDKYPDVFCDEPGLYTGVEHSIPVDSEFRPKRMREYKIPEKIKPQVFDQIQQLLAKGIIRRSNSPMVSPLVCILKGPGGRDGVRLAVDFRYLNAHTVSDAFPIPDPQEVIQKIGQARYLTVTYASHGYWQTPIKAEDQWKTGFICDDQLYEWTRTAFGMKSSGQTFCRAVQQIFASN